MTTYYEIVRFYREGGERVIALGLTLEEAQAFCSNPEGSSRTATEEDSLRDTAENGPWFDGYREEE